MVRARPVILLNRTTGPHGGCSSLSLATYVSQGGLRVDCPSHRALVCRSRRYRSYNMRNMGQFNPPTIVKKVRKLGVS